MRQQLWKWFEFANQLMLTCVFPYPTRIRCKENNIQVTHTYLPYARTFSHLYPQFNIHALPSTTLSSSMCSFMRTLRIVPWDGESYRGASMVIFSGPTWTNAHYLIIVCCIGKHRVHVHPEGFVNVSDWRVINCGLTYSCYIELSFACLLNQVAAPTHTSRKGGSTWHDKWMRPNLIGITVDTLC